MAEVNVSFLGEKYSVPEELQEFVDYLHFFEEIRTDLMPLLTKQMKEKSFSGGTDTDFAYFSVPLSKAGEKVIAKLADKKIYDVTLNDIVYNNKGYIQLQALCTETIKGMSQILINAMQNWLDSYNSAVSSASSSITGSGVSIWTNSLSSALIYTAMEASTIKKQTDKADREFRSAISALNTKVDDRKEEEERQLLVNKYYPGVSEKLSLFVSEMLSAFVEKLEQHSVFAYAKVKGYNCQRSSDLLKNISLVSDKVALLKEAFICCPYNPDVYNAAMENGLADIPTFETAQYFRQEGVLVDVIEKYAKANTSDTDKMETLVKVLAMYKGKEESSIWKSIYNEDYLRVHRRYSYFSSCINDKSLLISWIKENVTSDAVSLSEMSDEVLTDKVKRAVDSKVISDNQYALFFKLNMLEKEFDILGEVPNTQDLANNKFGGRILFVIKNLIPNIIAHIQKIESELLVAKKNYDEAQKEYEAKFTYYNSKESELRNKKSELGFFAFSKKKEIDIQIQECQDEFARFKESDKTAQLKKEYEQLEKGKHSFDFITGER